MLRRRSSSVGSMGSEISLIVTATSIFFCYDRKSTPNFKEQCRKEYVDVCLSKYVIARVKWVCSVERFIA